MTYVWDRAVRTLHWVLVVTIAVAWVSVLGVGAVALHEPAGYVAFAAFVLRIGWGFVGSRYARFDDFIRGPSHVCAYTRAVCLHREQRYIGHNPLGGWMVLILLAVVAATGVTGWLLTTDTFWGDERLGDLHELLAWLLLGLIALHVSGVVFTSVRHRENLLAALITGRKRSS